MPDKVRFYQKKELWAATIFLLGGIKYFAKPYTIAHQVADYSITVGIPLAMGILGVKDGIKNNSLPSGIDKVYRSIKNKNVEKIN